MKMIQTAARISAVAVACAVLAPGTPLRADEPLPPPPDEEVRIMLEVIEESLDTSSIGEWRSHRPLLSGFGTPVRGQYVPTVGAILTIPISFPISEPPAEAEIEPVEKPLDEQTDLWEKHKGPPMRGGMGGAMFGGGPTGDFPVDPENLQHRIVHKGDGDLLVDVQHLVDRIQGEIAEWQPVAESGLSLVIGEQEFDAAKVDALRATVLKTLAKYGHRMTCVAANERIIVIIESPGPVIARRHVVLRSEGGLGEDVKWRGFVPPMGRKGENWMLAAPKSSVAAETTAEALQSAIQEMKY